MTKTWEERTHDYNETSLEKPITVEEFKAKIETTEAKIEAKKEAAKDYEQEAKEYFAKFDKKYSALDAQLAVRDIRRAANQAINKNKDNKALVLAYQNEMKKVQKNILKQTGMGGSTKVEKTTGPVYDDDNHPTFNPEER